MTRFSTPATAAAATTSSSATCATSCATASPVAAAPCRLPLPVVGAAEHGNCHDRCRGHEDENQTHDGPGGVLQGSGGNASSHSVVQHPNHCMSCLSFVFVS